MNMLTWLTWRCCLSLWNFQQISKKMSGFVIVRLAQIRLLSYRFGIWAVGIFQRLRLEISHNFNRDIPVHTNGAVQNIRKISKNSMKIKLLTLEFIQPTLKRNQKSYLVMEKTLFIFLFQAVSWNFSRILLSRLLNHSKHRPLFPWWLKTAEILS